MEKTQEDNHTAVKKDLHGLKVSLFDPKNGLWAETNLNSGFRKTLTKIIWLILPVFLYGVVAFVLEVIPLAREFLKSI